MERERVIYSTEVDTRKYSSSIETAGVQPEHYDGPDTKPAALVLRVLM